ncbi:cytochrome C oxidase subunit IV family protein [Corallococcus sp. bb12-1]|uniref:cytochrome C oxidase subunit IV family protein n=1 Tax=Corallococcus sp. bb12-1 TaxID=2996784 RepID=UPI0022703544|nr:cytochrome C oxidase subunit IV family protein [Corallococcus sp. bb12-1]MCY1046937.1 cytochrome C oxidase subunit IV family protein [Corallococcus sp. bb12-1]
MAGEDFVEKPGRSLGVPGVLVVGAVLLALTALTYLLHTLPHGAWSLPVALIIAGMKGVLIALFYMHLREQRGSNALVLLTSVVFVAVLLTVCVLETRTRFAPTIPPGPFPVEPLPGLEAAPGAARPPGPAGPKQP